jgi:hypothetical protein
MLDLAGLEPATTRLRVEVTDLFTTGLRGLTVTTVKLRQSKAPAGERFDLRVFDPRGRASPKEVADIFTTG